MEDMKYFEVEREYLVIHGMKRYEINSDGSQGADAYDTEYDHMPREITTGYVVNSYYENGEHYMTDFYPVQTDTSQWTDNSEEVLEQIKEDYPPTEWQNNRW